MSCVLCRFCGTRVAFVEDYISINEIKHGIKYILRTLPGGIFKRVFNVLLLDKVNYNGITEVQSLFGTTVASANCGRCRTNLGWKFIAATPQIMCVREGIFLMKLDRLRLCNEENADQDLGANGQNANQDGDANEQAPNDQDGDANEQDLGDNRENAHQGGDANEEVPKTELMEMKIELFKMEIELINMERQLIKMGTLLFKMETTDQDGDATDQDGDTTDDQDEDTTDEDGDTTDQDEETTDQDGDTIDQDGGAPKNS
ncbi:hypothetical protein KY290_029261 [Solanum tuberosum]|uniref:Yippee domain-containing protein n=1 Tax=Solanum tuberosum TaxID=4113 RepID=A0ABQ7UK85_SOLTU|nr:hypothetical protein KY290_029261 [Solanum tuberosum]